jgi:ABC-type branched-subunit amino acid transport system ATPase component
MGERGAEGGPLLQIDGLGICAGADWPLREVTFEVAAGESVGLLGPRGAGKTALLDAISGFVHPARGRISLEGCDITGWPAHRVARAGVARSFQTPLRLDGQTVHDVVAAAAIGRGLSARATRESVQRALAFAGLGPEISGGVLPPPAGPRLIALARVAAAAPRLALLDEPLAGLVGDATGLVVSALRRLHASGATLLVTAHDPASLRVVCSRALVLRDGRIVAAGRPAEMRGA